MASDIFRPSFPEIVRLNQLGHFSSTLIIIREVLNDAEFSDNLNMIELWAWNAFQTICTNFLGKVQSPDYVGHMDTVLQTYRSMGCNMSLLIHFLPSHLDFFLIKPWRCQRWTWRAIPSGYQWNGEDIPRKMEPLHASWLLLVVKERQARGKLQKEAAC